MERNRLTKLVFAGCSNWRGVLPAVFLVLLSACSILPNETAAPTILPPDDKSTDNVKAKYFVDGHRVVAGAGSELGSSVLPFETTRIGLQTQILALRGAYRLRQKHLLWEVDGFSDTQFAGVLITTLGIATHSIPVRNVGGGIAGFSSFWTSHYETMVQATNYKTAADGLDCVYRKIDAIPQSFFDAAYDPATGLLYLSSDDLLKQDALALQTGYDSLASLFTSLNNSIYQIDQALQTSQTKLNLQAPSVSDIQTAIANSKLADTAAAKTTTGLIANAASAAAPAGAAAPAAPANAANAALVNQNSVNQTSGTAVDAPTATPNVAQPDLTAAVPNALAKKPVTALSVHGTAFGNLSSTLVANAIKLSADAQTCVAAAGGSP